MSKEITYDMIKNNPDKYIEINMIRKNRIVDTFYKYTDETSFKYKGKKFTIDSDYMLLIPKKDYFIPTLFYLQSKTKPLDFENHNKGIPSKILTLLYDLRLYKMLIKIEQQKINLFIVILDFIILCILGGVTYLLYNGGVL